jgi:hypothetical protein
MMPARPRSEKVSDPTRESRPKIFGRPEVKFLPKQFPEAEGNQGSPEVTATDRFGGVGAAPRLPDTGRSTAQPRLVSGGQKGIRMLAEGQYRGCPGLAGKPSLN